MADKRITDVDFIDSLNSDESFFVNQNNTIRQINKGDITFDIVNGGTGAKNALDARTNLGLGSVATENTVPINKGGTGAVTAADARIKLGITSANIGAKVSGAIESISTGGTGSSNGATGLANLFAAGATVLSSNQYGDALPAAGMVGRIFLKKKVNN